MRVETHDVKCGPIYIVGCECQASVRLCNRVTLYHPAFVLQRRRETLMATSPRSKNLTGRRARWCLTYLSCPSLNAFPALDSEHNTRLFSICEAHLKKENPVWTDGTSVAPLFIDSMHCEATTNTSAKHP